MKAKAVQTEFTAHPSAGRWMKRKNNLVHSFTKGTAAAGLVYAELTAPPRYERAANADLVAIGNDIRRVIEAYGEGQDAKRRRESTTR